MLIKLFVFDVASCRYSILVRMYSIKIKRLFGPFHLRTYVTALAHLLLLFKIFLRSHDLLCVD